MSTVLEKTEKQTSVAAQKYDFKSGNELSAYAAKQINYHIMGYYPITPSTEIAEYLDEMKADGEHAVNMIPGDGEHGAAGICFGASTAGGRVFNATSANGLLYAIEQLPVQSGSRYPMVLNIVCRSVSGPLDIRGDQSDIMMALNCGWIILFAKDQQAVYDLNILALKIGENENVRLPVIVAYDGFFTSHQKRRVYIFENDKDVQDFLGELKIQNCSIDPKNPITIGPYMNDPDLINNKKQLSLGMEAAYKNAIPQVFSQYEKLSGRKYNFLETYKMEDAEVALFITGSSFDTTKIAVDKLRAEGKKVGAVHPNVIRPFPANEVREIFKNVKALLVADRQDSYGAWGGNMTLEVKAALKDDAENKTLILSRVYGLGGKEFFVEDALEMFELVLKTAQTGKIENSFDYFGANAGDENYISEKVFEPITEESASNNFITVEEKDGKVVARGVNPRKLAGLPKRIAPGHGACPGCGIFPSVDQFMKGLKGFVVVLFHTGCGMVVTTGYPYTSFKITYIHNLFQNGAATVSGVVEMFEERQRRGEIPADEEITFLMVTGDGGNDIGMGPTIGAALRNHHMIVLEYDNEGYMNTGNQLSYCTPLGHATSTSHVGKTQKGKKTHHKDTAQIMAATHISYVFTGAECNYLDLIKKAAKAQYYAKKYGFVFGKVLSACPLSWRSDASMGAKIVQAAVDCCFFPLYEVENGITTINYDPEKLNKRVPAIEWLKTMGKTKHLVKPEYKEVVEDFEKEVERRWKRLKAMHENPLL